MQLHNMAMPLVHFWPTLPFPIHVRYSTYQDKSSKGIIDVPFSLKHIKNVLYLVKRGWPQGLSASSFH